MENATENHESRTVLKCSTNALFVIFPDGATDMMPWNSIERITIETNDSGPLGSDMWWCVSDNARTVRFPSGATGEKEFLQRVQTFSGFDNDTLIAATQSTEHAEFTCWQRPSTQ